MSLSIDSENQGGRIEEKQQTSTRKDVPSLDAQLSRAPKAIGFMLGLAYLLKGLTGGAHDGALPRRCEGPSKCSRPFGHKDTDENTPNGAGKLDKVHPATEIEEMDNIHSLEIEGDHDFPSKGLVETIQDSAPSDLNNKIDVWAAEIEEDLKTEQPCLVALKWLPRISHCQSELEAKVDELTAADGPSLATLAAALRLLKAIRKLKSITKMLVDAQ